MLRHDRLHPLSQTHVAELYSVAKRGWSSVSTESVGSTMRVTALF
jgi:hypothetical protein